MDHDRLPADPRHRHPDIQLPQAALRHEAALPRSQPALPDRHLARCDLREFCPTAVRPPFAGRRHGHRSAADVPHRHGAGAARQDGPDDGRRHARLCTRAGRRSLRRRLHRQHLRLAHDLHRPAARAALLARSRHVRHPPVLRLRPAPLRFPWAHPARSCLYRLPAAHELSPRPAFRAAAARPPAAPDRLFAAAFRPSGEAPAPARRASTAQHHHPAPQGLHALGDGTALLPVRLPRHRLSPAELLPDRAGRDGLHSRLHPASGLHRRRHVRARQRPHLRQPRRQEAPAYRQCAAAAEPPPLPICHP